MIKGAFLTILATLCFTIMGSLIKATPNVPVGETVFFRAFFTLPVIFVWLALTHDLKNGLKVQNWKLHVRRALVGCCAMGLGFAGIRFIPLPEATALRFITPVFILVFAAVILGERFKAVRLFAVCLGLIGVAIIMWPRMSFDFSDLAFLGVTFTLASAALAGLAQVFVRSMAKTERTAAIAFYFMSTAAALSLLTIPFGWVVPSKLEFALLVLAGVVGGLGQILQTSAFRLAEAGIIAPFTYAAMIWALIIGFVMFDEVPTSATIIGAALVMFAGSLIVWRERKLGKQATAKDKAAAKAI